MDTTQSILCLDIGAVRIGVARASALARLPEILTTIIVDGTELTQIKKFIDTYNIDTIVIGLPQNAEGKDTQQTTITRDFAKRLEHFSCKIVWQDERLSSVRAREELGRRKGLFAKEDVDSLAALYILEDYLNKV